MSDRRVSLPQGTLDLPILRALALEPMHGWSISERIHEVSHATLQIPQGSLYPALHRLERRGWIKAEGHVRQRIAFGGVERAKDESRDARGTHFRNGRARLRVLADTERFPIRRRADLQVRCVGQA
jgi:DNA-binding PadR family transcriptional regulator